MSGIGAGGWPVNGRLENRPRITERDRHGEGSGGRQSVMLDERYITALAPSEKVLVLLITFLSVI